jgi:hypothetical protein
MDQTQELITSSDKTPLVKILTLMFLSICVLAAIARIATKLSMVGKLRWDDYLTTISAVSTCYFTDRDPQQNTNFLSAAVCRRSIRCSDHSVWEQLGSTYRCAE